MENVCQVLLMTGLVFCSVCVGDVQESCPQSSCESQLMPERHGHSLLQARAGSPRQALLQTDADQAHRGSMVSDTVIVSSAGQGKARDLLSSDLLQLGIELMGSEEVVDELVVNSRFENVTYAGVPMLLRMVNGDFGNYTLWDEGHELYGLDSLEGLLDKPHEKQGINMIDLGGNYGAVSIAAFKKYPTQLRAITVEPIPTTYFFMRWNMALNNVPALAESDFKKGSKSGLLTLNHAVVSNKRESIEVCYTPPYTMMAQVCSCQDDPTWPGKQCKQVTGITTKGLFDLFGTDPVTIVKIDCEGCEFSSLPALMEILKEDPHRVRRLVGELHFPTPELEKMACQLDSGQYFVRLCRTEENPVQPMPLTCGADPTPCDTDDNTAAIMKGIKTQLHA